MKRNFDAVLCNLDNVPIVEKGTPDGLLKVYHDIRAILTPDQAAVLDRMMIEECAKPLTLSSVCVNALLGIYEDERNTLTDAQRFKRMELARKAHAGGIVDLSIDDLSELNNLVKKRYLGVLIPVLTKELLEKEPGDASAA